MLINSPNISGSLTVTGNSVISGSLTVLGSITGAITGSATSASYVEYSNVANKPALVSGSSQVTYSGLTGVPSGIVSGSSQITYSGLTGVPSGIVSGSAQIASFGIFATTGSNGFNGSQSITGSLTVTGQVVAQTLNVQQVTSSIVYSSGSNVFGNTLGNTQQFTGSVGVTGSLTVAGAGTFTGNVSLNSSNLILGLGNNANNERIIFSYNTDAASRSWRIVKDWTAFGDFQIQQSTTQAGTTYADILRFSPAGAATFSSSITSFAASPLVASVSSNSANDAVLAARWTSGLGMEMRYNPDSAIGFIQNTYPVEVNQLFGDIQFRHSVSGTMTSRMIIKGYSGNVGINILLPTSRFHVSGASNLDGYNLASSFQFTRAADNTVSPASGNGILVFAGGNAQMRMDTANQINFDMNNGGTPHTVLTLRQNGNAVSINSPDNNLMLELKYQNVASGYLGAIGSALYAYSVNGGYVLLNASSAWVNASDVKRKRNFEPYTKGLSAILGLQPKLYNMDFQKDGDAKQVGLVAQEVKDFIPLAYEENDKFIGLNYNAIIVTMVKAIQELKSELDTAKTEIQLLKQQ